MNNSRNDTYFSNAASPRESKNDFYSTSMMAGKYSQTPGKSAKKKRKAFDFAADEA
tara:strand:+ start:164 stop:331 length:168 start_codon:yes stop_codon:yes gene_type:complete